MNRPSPFCRTILWISPFLSFVCYYLALPPINWWPLIFFVPAFWIPILETPKENLPKGTYRIVYFATVLFWSLTNIWLPLPHWGIWFGWLAISLALGLYFLTFICTTRFFVGKSIPVWLVAPLFWIGIEWIRFHGIGGFSFCALQHALYLHPEYLQTSSWFGEYSVAALIFLIGCFLGKGIFLTPCAAKNSIVKRLGWFLLAAIVWLTVAGTGRMTIQQGDRQLHSPETAKKDSPLRLLLIQDGTPLRYPLSDETEQAIHDRYVRLTEEAVHTSDKSTPIDMIVWPEGTCAQPFFAVSEGGYFPGMETLDPKTRARHIETTLQEQNESFLKWIQSLETPLLVGGILFEYKDSPIPTVYNTAILESIQGVVQRYDKVKRVIMGEYIPFVEYLPDSFPIKTLCTPIGAGKENGDFEINGHPFVVSICFESSLPHFYFQKINRSKRAPEFLLNISNDGWFHGGVESFHHKTNYIFRAIENRRWLVAAVHGSASLAVDPVGRIQTEGEHCKSGSLPVEFSPILPPPRRFPFLLYVPFGCALIFSLSALWCWGSYRRSLRKKEKIDGSVPAP